MRVLQKLRSRASYLNSLKHYGGDDRCWICGGKNEPYMLANELWRSLITPSKRDKLVCVRCVEKKIGRPLILRDFLGFEPGAKRSPPPINLGLSGFDARVYTKLFWG